MVIKNSPKKKNDTAVILKIFHVLLPASYKLYNCAHTQDKQRMECLKYIGVVDGAQTSLALNPILEEEWCYLHNLVPTSLHNINDICKYYQVLM